MTEIKNNGGSAVSVSIGRQPVFDDKRRLWGYELFCVGSAETTPAGLPEESGAAVSVASSAYMGLQHIIDRGRKVVVNFNEKNLLENLPYALPPVLTAVQVTEQVSKRPSVMEQLSRFKSDGYLIVIAGFSADPVCEKLYRLADVLSMEVAHRTKEELAVVLDGARSFDALLLASRVADTMRLESCLELGFSLFHGSFFKSPDKITVRKLSSHEAARFNLLRLIEMNEPDVAQLAKAIQTDASISFRLLVYLNSAAFGLSRKIQSIPHAISLLGWQQIKNWLRVILLADMSQNKEASELILLSAQRGKFLELIAREHDFWGFDPASLHLLGVFSLLDILIGISMQEVVVHLALDPKLKAALCREPNNEYVPLLQLARYFEEAKWPEADKMMQQLNLDSRKVKTAFQTSLNWAGELLSLPAAESEMH